MKRIILLLLIGFFGLASFAQEPDEAQSTLPGVTKSSSSVSLKTLRSLFPDVPVAVANEIYGGLHSVNTIDELHGKEGDLKLSDEMLQKGMLIYVVEANMYFRYKGEYNGESNGEPTDENKGTYGENSDYWQSFTCLLYTSPSPRDKRQSRMPSSA